MKRKIVAFSWVAALATTLTLLPWLGTPADAYGTWTTNGTNNCASCHGDFLANGYTSQVDASAWLMSGSPTSLHDGHRTVMLSSDCNTCHSAGSFTPVSLFSSSGGTGFSPISCLGCHGRRENGPGGPGKVTGTGLRQAHYRATQTVCLDCHDDSDPAGQGSFIPVAENVRPPYYFTPDTAHPKKSTNPCNKGGNTESKIASGLGLDNDGNGLFDGDDSACAGPAPKVTLDSPNGGEALTAGSIQTILWTAVAEAVNFKLSFSIDNGITWAPVIAGNPYVTGISYDWRIPAPPGNKKKSLVKITAYDATNKKLGTDRSDAPFAIEVVRLTSPNGGEALTAGAQVNITWSIFETTQPITKVTLLFTKNGGLTWSLIANLTAGPYSPGDHSQPWTVPSVAAPKTKCRVKVVLKDAAGVTRGNDVSDASFTISP
jgi:hypothetical protein